MLLKGFPYRQQTQGRQGSAVSWLLLDGRGLLRKNTGKGRGALGIMAV